MNKYEEFEQLKIEYDLERKCQILVDLDGNYVRDNKVVCFDNE